jgi:hypothetical protein
MAELIIDNAIAERLRQIAQQENRPLDAVLRSMLESYSPAFEPSNWPLQLATLAAADTDIVWSEDAADLSERSREILEDELADYLQ